MPPANKRKKQSTEAFEKSKNRRIEAKFAIESHREKTAADLLAKEAAQQLDFHKIVGNQVNRLLTSAEILNSIQALFPRTDADVSKVDYCIKFLRILGKIQAFSKARWLDVEQMGNLSHKIDDLRNLVLQVI